MGLFEKLFGKKKQDKQKEFDLGDGMFANEKGEVYGEYLQINNFPTAYWHGIQKVKPSLFIKVLLVALDIPILILSFTF